MAKPKTNKAPDELADPRWQRRRLEAMERDGFACLRCGATDRTLNVHHVRYHEHLWDTPAEWLQTLCEPCHRRFGAHPRGGVAWERDADGALALVVYHCPACGKQTIDRANGACKACGKPVQPRTAGAVATVRYRLRKDALPPAARGDAVDAVDAGDAVIEAAAVTALLSVAEAAELLSAAGLGVVEADVIEDDVASGMPVNEDGTIDLVQYAAWLTQQHAVS